MVSNEGGLRSQPPPLLPKPKMNGNLLSISSSAIPQGAPSIYAKPRNPASTLPWVVAPTSAKPPRSLPLSSSVVHSPEKSSDSSPSSPQWPAVYVSFFSCLKFTQNFLVKQKSSCYPKILSDFKCISTIFSGS